MNPALVIVTVALLVTSMSVGAASFRLAFSRAENVEIFVEHAEGVAWCSPKLEVRAVYGGAPDEDALSRLFPKLGALLDAQCPAANIIEWVSATADGRKVAQGTSAKADLWTLRTSPTAVAEASTGSLTADTIASPPETRPPPTPPVPEAEVPQQVASTTAPASPATIETEVASPEPPAAPEITVGVMPSHDMPTAQVPVVPEASQQVASTAVPAPTAEAEAGGRETPDEAPSPAQAPVAVIPPPVATPAPSRTEPPATPPANVIATETPSPPQAPIGDFAIRGWKPADEAVVRQSAGFLTELEDQNGCRMVTRFDRPLDLQYLSLRSEGLECDSDGYLSGQGRVALERSDGAIVARTGQLWFAGGLGFNQQVERARIAASDAQRNLWLYLGGDLDTRTHFMLRARPANQGVLGIWTIDPQVDAVTEQDSRFREAQHIREAIAAALSALETYAMPGAASARILFSSDFQRGTVAGDQNYLAYMINASRRVDRRTRKVTGEWQFNLQQGANYVFQRDARLAQQKRAEEAREAQRVMMEQQQEAQRVRMAQQREAQRRQQEIAQQINQEQRSLQTYRQFVDEAARDPNRLLSRIESDIGYEPFSGGAYAQLVGGGASTISRIVRVDGRDGDDAKILWPYEMRLIGRRDLADGWYRIQGRVTVDANRRDGDDLPLTLVAASEDGVQPCAQAGCEDLATPVSLTRMTLGVPDWTPEASEARIRELQQQ